MRRDAVEKIHSTLRITHLAFDVNLLVSMKRAGFKTLEVPIEWTDKVGSKVTSSLFRSSFTMFLSVRRIRPIYSPLYKFLRPLRPLEGWVYKKLCATQPLSFVASPKFKVQSGLTARLWTSGFGLRTSKSEPRINTEQQQIDVPSVCSATSIRPGNLCSMNGSVNP